MLQAARIAKGLTQEEVQQACADLGAPGGNVSRMENGATRWPHPATIAALTVVLDLTIEQMFAVPAPAGADSPGPKTAVVPDQEAA